MSDLIQVKNSQLSLYKTTQLYTVSQKGEPVLYKKEGEVLEYSGSSEEKHPELFILGNDRKAAAKELHTGLNMGLARAMASKGVRSVRSMLNIIVEEALTGSLDDARESLPETIEIMFYGYSKNQELLTSLITIKDNVPLVVEHSINILSIALLYCCNHDIPINAAKKIGLSALLHDIGTIQIDQEIIETKQKLSEEDYKLYQTHAKKGYDLIKKSTHFDETVALVALEHHEKLDGSGYPRGITDISFESQLIGLIGSYEPLTYREKEFRHKKTPYDTLQLLKKEVIAGKYNKEIFINLCSCLIK